MRERLGADDRHAHAGGDHGGIFEGRRRVEVALERLLQLARAARGEDAAVLAALLDAREEALVRRAALAPLRPLVLHHHVRQALGRVHAQRRIVGLRHDVHVGNEARRDGERDADADLQPFHGVPLPEAP